MKEYIEKSEVERMLWAVIMSKEERTIEEMLEDAQVVTVIPIPEGATNGDMIMAMFNCMVIDITNGKVYVENIYFPFDEDWWNAPYKKEVLR